MATVFQKPKALTSAPLHYCPGCTHGIVHRLVAQAIDELGVEGRTVEMALFMKMTVMFSPRAAAWTVSAVPMAARSPSP